MNWQTISKSFFNNTENLCKYFFSVLKKELKINKYYDQSELHKLAARLEKHNYIKKVGFDIWDTEEELDNTIIPFTMIVTFECVSDGYESTVTVNLGMFGVHSSVMIDGFEDPYIEVKSDYFKY